MVAILDDQPSDATPGASLDSGSWTTLLSLNCTFPATIFQDVMLNLVKNPNLTSSFLFRADILVDTVDCKYLDQIKAKYRPRPFSAPGWILDRTIVRELIPRNVQVDSPLIQTCHFLSCEREQLIVYIPHADCADDIPYYHPKVQRIAFQYRVGAITLKFDLYDQLNDRLQRTGLKLLQTIHKHGQGLLAGYEKRVHHDQLVPQRAYQDTYTKLKVKYAKNLVDNWVEVTDPGKHVFEDIGIAAFLIELWKTYDPFPGFVDIGCGNGLLTYLLCSEGYKGYGFDARRRKTWSLFPDIPLYEKVLTPNILGGDDLPEGVFIVSNHADELTCWTPLLAALSGGAFMALPCCSHDLSGKRFRAPPPGKHVDQTRLPQQLKSDAHHETGSLKRTLVQQKMASAYSTLCSYVEWLTVEVGFEVETEVLRIPSTRNNAIVGRRLSPRDDLVGHIRELLQRELKMSIDDISKAWQANAERISQKPASGH